MSDEWILERPTNLPASAAAGAIDQWLAEVESFTAEDAAAWDKLLSQTRVRGASTPQPDCSNNDKGHPC